MERHYSTILILALAATLATCAPSGDSSKPVIEADAFAAKPQKETDPLPELDLRSPDSVVKSYWALQNWVQENSANGLITWVIAPSFEDYYKSLQQMGTGDYALAHARELEGMKSLNSADQDTSNYSREIIEVRNESETRSVVFTKILNVTPIPNDIELSEDELDKRAFGRDVKYIVEKTKDGWRLSQAWYRDKLTMALANLDKSKTVPADGWTKTWEVERSTSEKRGRSSYSFYSVPND